KNPHLLTTVDTPNWGYRWIYQTAWLQRLRAAQTRFCGITPVRSSIFGVVKDSDSATRARWLQEAHDQGSRLRDGVLTRGERWRKAVSAWIAARRLQFHPMAWGAYGVGAAGAYHATSVFDATAFWLGLLSLFFLEAATVFTNEYFDFDSDRRNQNFGPFTGGSRVLVDGRIDLRRMRLGIAVAMGSFLLTALALAPIVPASSLIPLGLLAILAVGYTTPPLKLCWRGLGELERAFTHGTALIWCGFLFQGGGWAASFPVLASLPLLLAI